MLAYRHTEGPILSSHSYVLIVKIKKIKMKIGNNEKVSVLAREPH